MVAKLERLPPELLLAIARQPNLRLKDIGALSQCSTLFHHAFNRLLYKLDAQSPTRWALLWACITGNVDAARMSIVAGSPVSAPCDYRMVEWHTGIKLDNGPLAQYGYAQTPLNVAALHDREEVVCLLLEHEANVNSVTGFDMAIRKGLDDLFDLYLPLLVEVKNRTEMTSAFELAVKHDRKRIFMALCDIVRDNPYREDHHYFAFLQAIKSAFFAWFKELYDMNFTALEDHDFVAELWSECARIDTKTADQVFDFLLQQAPWLDTHFHDSSRNVWEEILLVGNLTAVKKLWKYVDKEDIFNEPVDLLESVIASKNYELVQFALEKCSEADARIDEYLPMLTVSCASEYGTVEIIKLLQAHGGDLEGRWHEKDAMHYAIKGANQSVVHHLLESGFQVPTDAFNHLWVHRRLAPLPENDSEPSPAFVKLLLDNGAAANIADETGKVLLHRVFGHYGFGNGDVSARFDTFLELVKLLVSHGADINSMMDLEGVPRLFCQGGVQFVQYLFDQSAFDSISAEDLYEWFRCAYDWQDVQVVGLLLPRVLDSIKSNLFPDFSGVEESVADIYDLSRRPRTGRYQVLKLLLSHEEFCGDRAEFFLLNLCSARHADDKSLRLLLDKGVDCQCLDNLDNEDFRETPLHIACYMNHPTLVKILLEAGSDVNATDGSGNIPFDHAISNHYSEWPLDPTSMTQLLLMYGSKTGRLTLAGTMSEKVDKVRELWKASSTSQDQDEDGEFEDGGLESLEIWMVSD